MTRQITVLWVVLFATMGAAPAYSQTSLGDELGKLAQLKLEEMQVDWRKTVQQHILFCRNTAAADRALRQLATVGADPSGAAALAAAGLETTRLDKRKEEKVAFVDMLNWRDGVPNLEFKLAPKSAVWQKAPVAQVTKTAEFSWLHWTSLWEFLERYESTGSGYWISELRVRQNFSDMRYVMGVVGLSALSHADDKKALRARDREVLAAIKGWVAADKGVEHPRRVLREMCPAPSFAAIPSLSAHRLFREVLLRVSRLSMAHAGEPGTPANDPVRLFEMSVGANLGGEYGAGQGQVTVFVAHGPVLGLLVKELAAVPCLHDLKIGRYSVQTTGKLTGWVQMAVSFNFGCQRVECYPDSLRRALDPRCQEVKDISSESQFETAYAYLQRRISRGPLAAAREVEPATGADDKKTRWVREQELVKAEDAWTYQVDTDYLHSQSSDAVMATRPYRFFSMRDQRSGQPRGVKVMGVKAGTLLHVLGVRSKDVLVSVGDRKLGNSQAAVELIQALSDARRGETVALTLERRGVIRTLQWNLR